MLNSMRLMAGVRLESAAQSVSTFSPFTGDDPLEANLENTDILPSASATWLMSKAMQLRAGYGRTVSRPEFRELSAARFDDVTNRRSVVVTPISSGRSSTTMTCAGSTISTQKTRFLSRDSTRTLQARSRPRSAAVQTRRSLSEIHHQRIMSAVNLHGEKVSTRSVSARRFWPVTWLSSNQT